MYIHMKLAPMTQAGATPCHAEAKAKALARVPWLHQDVPNLCDLGRQDSVSLVNVG